MALLGSCSRVLGASVSTICNWEGNYTNVATRFLPRVIIFLGYDPRQETGAAWRPDSDAAGAAGLLAGDPGREARLECLDRGCLGARRVRGAVPGVSLV